MERFRFGKWNNIDLENGKIKIWKWEKYRSGKWNNIDLEKYISGKGLREIIHKSNLLKG